MKVFSYCIALIALTSTGCPSHPETCEETEHIPGAQTTLTALTYNTGLGPGLVRYTSQRSPEVIEALADEPFDVLCLQEVWLQEDSDAITKLFEDKGFHVLRADTRGRNESSADVCEPGMLDPVLECSVRECPGWSDQDISLCALKKCVDPLTDVLRQDPNCVICAATSTGKSPEEIEQTCTSSGSSRIHEGGNGVILVSKYPLSRRETLHLPASFANRVAQMARIELPTGPVEIACTHISANQALPPLQSEASWWTEEKEMQIQLVSDRLKERGECVPQMLLGDLNTSRDNGTLIESDRSAYDIAESEGLESPAATWSPPICSSCAENTFKSSTGTSRLIDHIMSRTEDVTIFNPVAIERVLDWTVEIDEQGMLLDTSLSDHFGIRLTFDISTE